MENQNRVQWYTKIIRADSRFSPANERQRYIETLSLIGWAHTLNDPCTWYRIWQLIIYGKLNILGPRQNGCHFANDIFILIFFYDNCCIFIQISVTFVTMGATDFESALVQDKVCRWKGNKPLSEPMITKTNDAFMRLPVSRIDRSWSQPHCGDRCSKQLFGYQQYVQLFNYSLSAFIGYIQSIIKCYIMYMCTY